MSSPDKHINTWSMTDVRKYLAGELPAREMHDLEQAALDDPFLADALEGLAVRANPAASADDTQPSPLDHDLTELRARLDARVNDKKNRSLLPRWIQVAAAAILLLGLGSTIYFTQGKSKLNVDIEPQPAAEARSAPPPASTAPVPSMVAPATPPAVSAAPQAVSAARPAPTTRAPTQPAAAPAAVSRVESRTADSADKAGLAEYKPAAPAKAPADLRAIRLDTTSTADSYAVGYGTKKKQDNELLKWTPGLSTDSAQYNAEFRRAASSIGAKSERFGDQPSLVFSGRVLDAGNRPLAGASVYLHGSRNGFLTDGEGKFNVYVAPQDTARMVTVAKLGYEQASYALNTAAIKDNTIRLQENRSTLNEVVVTGLGIKRKETLAAPPSDEKEDLDSSWIRTSPVVSREAYLDYLATAKKTLPVDTTIRGLESISFIVDRHGEYTDFKIERSLSPSHDAALIRLIMDGPAWKSLRRKKVRAVVTVSFP